MSAGECRAAGPTSLPAEVRSLPALDPPSRLPCADPRSRTLSFTGLGVMSTGILRHPDAVTLGVSQLTHTALFSANRSDFHTRNVHKMYKQNITLIIGNNRKIIEKIIANQGVSQ